MRRVTKVYFYRAGGFSNPQLSRRMRAGRWQYYEAAR